MRLIDADRLIEQFKNKNIQIAFDLPVEEILGQDVDLDDFSMLMQDAIQAYKKMVIDTIRNQPTAYDVDAVVERLKEKAIPVLDEDEHIVPESYVHEGCEIKMIALSNAIEVVKGT